MGILNVTPDSFSDGGTYADDKAAVRHGLEMADLGADIIDVGGESTRPGAEEVPEAEEIDRVIPVIEQLRQATDKLISVDTMKAGVARRALASGADIINDVSALTRDPAMAAVARETGAGVILMHMQGTPRTMQKQPAYEDVVADVSRMLAARVGALVDQGLDRATLAVDPGIGFGKTAEHNVQLLGNLPALTALHLPLVVGLSRKRFLGSITGRHVHDRLAGSLAALVFCVLNGAHVMRVHDVDASRDAVRVATALLAVKRRDDPSVPEK